jgi:TPR repeat protein
MLKIIIILQFILFYPIFVFSQESLKDADYYYSRSDYKSAFRIYNNNQNILNGEQSYYLSRIYTYGLGSITINHCSAKRLLEQSFNQGYYISGVDLGYSYEKGLCNNDDRSESKAFYYYKQAADYGDKVGQYNVGVFYEKGIGISMNKSMAKDYFLKSSNNGYLPAMSKLISFYILGTDGNKDYDSARKWAEYAINQNYTECKGLIFENLGWLLENGLGGNKDLYRAREMYKIGCQRGQSSACNR